MSGGKSKAKLKAAKLCTTGPEAASLEVFNPRFSLSSLNTYVLHHLLLFLDVPSLEQLASTSTFFNQLIKGQTITNLHIPFSQEFLLEMHNADVLEKKPVLRITVSESYMEAHLGVQPGFIDFCSREFATSVLHYQLSLLDLTKLRDLVIKPSSGGNLLSGSCTTTFNLCGEMVLQALARFGVLRQLGRLEAPVGVLRNYHRSAATLRFYHGKFMAEFNQMRKLDLATLNLFIVDKCDLQYLNTASARERFLRYFEPLDLTITVLPFVKFTKKKPVVVDINSEYISIVKSLHIIGPCSLQFRPEMENLKEVRVSPIQRESSTCTLPRVPEANRATHRQGVCCMDVRALWRKCPLVTKFNGISLKAQGGWSRVGARKRRWRVVFNELGESFPKWNSACKKAFFKDYLGRGGQLGLKSWGKTHWNGRQLKWSQI